MVNPQDAVVSLPDLGGAAVIVTGAGGGVGEGIARQFAAAGAAVLLHYRSSAVSAEALAAQLRSVGGNAVAAQADLVDPAQCEALVARALTEFGRLDHLVNNAGVQPIEPLATMTVPQWRDVIDTNTTATFAATQAAVAAMGDGGGTVTHIASIEGSRPAAAHSHYCASKAAIIMHARTAALEYGPRGIRVNSVSPGLVHRDGLDEGWPDGVARWKANAPLGRLGHNTDIGNACVFLASPMAAWISGVDLVVDGGMSASSSW